MKYISLLFIVFSLVFSSCSDKNDEPTSKSNKLIGYWAITHIKTIEHFDDSHNTFDKVVPPHGLDAYVSENNPRWDVLIFDEDFVTIRGDMPNRPKSNEYDLDTVDGQIEYSNDLDKWEQSIGKYSDVEASPVGLYSLRGNELIIGTLNMGILNFTSDNEFTLDFRKSISGSENYIRLIYTYSRIYSLTM